MDELTHIKPEYAMRPQTILIYGVVVLVALGLVVLDKEPPVLPLRGMAMTDGGIKSGRDGMEIEIAPVVRFLRQVAGKPPRREITVRLAVNNAHDRPLWIVTRYCGDAPLPLDGKFAAGFFSQPFEGDQYGDGDSRLVKITFLGSCNSFTAFLIPAKGSIRFDEFSMLSLNDVRQMEFWEVESLRVNGRIPLEKWLPYNSLSGKHAEVLPTTHQENLAWDPKRLAFRTDYPLEEVQFVEAKARKKWLVPISGLKTEAEK